METFVVRVWKPAGDEAADLGELHGIVERPGGVLVKPFQSAQELLDALRAEVSDAERLTEFGRPSGRSPRIVARERRR